MCAPGATRTQGMRKVECLDGAWTGLTLQCKVSCPEPKDRLKDKYMVVHGVMASYGIGDVLDFQCLEPYVLNGFSRSTCGPRGKWISLPRCKRVCHRPLSTNPNAYHVDNRTHFAAGDRVSYTCAPGYNHTGGNAHQTCKRVNWMWSPLEIQCERVRSACDRPVSSDPNAYHEDSRTHFSVGDRVRYSCAIGHSHTGGSWYRTCTSEDRSWTPLQIQCEPKSCGSAGELFNGDLIYEGVQFGDVVRAVCKEGHILVGKATRTCLNAGWDGRQPSCEAVRCSKPETNAEETGGWHQLYKYLQVIGFRCQHGTLVGQRHIWCTARGTWSHPVPFCRGT